MLWIGIHIYIISITIENKKVAMEFDIQCHWNYSKNLKLKKRYGVVRRTSAPYQPATNGQAQRFTIKNGWNADAEGMEDNKDNYMEVYMKNYT